MWRWGEWIWLTGLSGLHRNLPQGLNISSIRIFDQIRNLEIPLTLHPPFSYHHHECSVQGQVLHYKCRNLRCRSAEGRSSTANSGTKAAVLPGMNRCGSLLLLSAPHSLFSMWTDLKRPQGHHMQVRRVDLANWALWTSSKFATGVKYWFHQGFWPDERSRNPNHPSPPWNYIKPKFCTR